MSLLSVFLGREICGMPDWAGCEHFGQYDAVMNSDDVSGFVDKDAEEFLKNELELFPSGFRAVGVPGDGNCLSHAVSKSCIGVELLYHALRKEVQNELREHKEWYWKKIYPFFDEETAAEYIETAAVEAVPRESAADEGCQGMAEFLGPLHIHAMANVLRRPIVLMSTRDKWEQSLAGVYLPERRRPFEWTSEAKLNVMESSNAVTQDPLFESSALCKPFKAWLGKIDKLVDPIDLSVGNLELKMSESEKIGSLCDELSEILRVCVLPAGELEAKASKEFVVTFDPAVSLGIGEGVDGVVADVHEGGQAQACGIQRGWKLKAVNNQACQSFGDKAYREALQGDTPCQVTFEKPFDVGTRVQAVKDIFVGSTLLVKAGIGGRMLSPDEDCRKAGAVLVQWDRIEQEEKGIMGNIAKACPSFVEKEASIEGMWEGGFIVGTCLCWKSGLQATINIVTPKTFTVSAENGDILTAALKDDGKLHWDDGDVWEKYEKVAGATELARNACKVHQAIHSVRLRTPLFIAWSSAALSHFVCLLPTTPGGRLSTKALPIQREALPQRDGQIQVFGEPEDGLTREESCKLYLEGGFFSVRGNTWPNKDKFLEKVEAVWRKDHPKADFQAEVLVKGWNILLPNILNNVLDIAQLFKSLNLEDDDDPVWLRVGRNRLIVPRRIETLAYRLPQLEYVLLQAADRMRPIWITAPDEKSVLTQDEDFTIEWDSLAKISSLVEKKTGIILEDQMVEIGWMFAGRAGFTPNIAVSVPFHYRRHVWKVPANFQPGRYWLAVRLIPFQPPEGLEIEGAGPPQGAFQVRAKPSEDTSDTKTMASEYSMGERVECRNEGQPWMDGTVTSVSPLKVLQDGKPKSHEWDEVRKIGLRQAATPVSVQAKRDETTTFWEYRLSGDWYPCSYIHEDFPGFLTNAYDKQQRELTVRVGSRYYNMDFEQMKIQQGSKLFALRRNGEFKVNKEALTALTEMGFSEVASRRALEQCYNDSEMAIHYMFNNDLGDEPEPDVDLPQSVAANCRDEAIGNLPAPNSGKIDDATVPTSLPPRMAWDGDDDDDDDLYTIIDGPEERSSGRDLDIAPSSQVAVKEIGVPIPHRELKTNIARDSSSSSMPLVDEQYLATMEKEARTWELKGESLWQKFEEELKERLGEKDTLKQPTLQRTITTSNSKPSTEIPLAPVLSRTKSAPPVMMDSLSRHQWATLFHQARDFYN